MTAADRPATAHAPSADAAVRRARELADLLRSRRERLQPADVGLPIGARRRTRGLRREEVAQLAAISTTYYTFLEQGRDVHPSRQVLDALARALRLGPAERAHLHELAHGHPAPTAPGTAEALAPSVVALVHRLDPHPTYVTGRRFDVLTANRAARALWTDWPALPPQERNMLWWMFTDPAARTILIEWETEASALLARFRAAADRHPDDPEFAAVIGRLQDASPQVRAWWPRHDIVALSSGTKRLRHPILGDLNLEHVVLQLADDPEQKLVTFTADRTHQQRIAQLIADQDR
ncbi:MAG: helix-turn-helix domain-containing protein [Nocardioidaceae bacterium]|nr:helix-turn-helix domain-containing protein [Nocardioidaceae bacterium]